MQRREFMKKTAIAGVALAAGTSLFGAAGKSTITCKGYAAFDESGELKPWKFQRRAVRENDILFEVKATSICHSDIHTELGHWGKQTYPQVPGHEIVGVVTEVGSKVTKFKVGDRVGVGCMVDNADVPSLQGKSEQYDANTVFTYGQSYKAEPTGISQGGYSDYFVVHEHFAVHLPDDIDFNHAAPLMCAGITTYSPLMKYQIKKSDNVGVAGIGGLGHLAVKIALSKGANVTAFTTTPSKVKDIQSWGAAAVVVSSPDDLAKFRAKFDYVISTIPYEFDMMPYIAMVKPFGNFTVVGMPVNFSQKIQTLALAATKVNFNASLIGDMKETQEMVDYCAKNKIYPEIEIIKADEINAAWKKVVNKEARYRFVIDPKTF
ncbi:zinc-dependent alcohol dehydrogenase [Campylobacter iguaniorum]|uniref:NAD(P)-dependent alcohol dehydrogenase n=1 Tax=Campylobacter iguaniorum TaxID=1244531 RepID=UPI00073A3D07|nr:NAD(P)-dependent alcohol dehydrogenase [Campylobacter iguaniorum]ALV25344.1 zinc-dependent alcohol dehydrogenase [Campylobacter iguaniorum]